MYPCKLCGKKARTKKQEKIGENRYRQFNQCQNLLCGHCFTTIEELNVSDNKRDLTAFGNTAREKYV